MKYLAVLLFTGLLAASYFLFARTRGVDSPSYPDSPQQHAGRFRNAVLPSAPLGFWKRLQLMWIFFFNKPGGTTPTDAIPVDALTRDQLLAAPDRSLYRLGHSTLLLKLRGRFWLTDPVFSDRVSPVDWAGPIRFHASPISVQELPPIEGVILSHNHYDHLDRAAIVQLADKTAHFLAPLGVGDQLVAWGIDADKVQQFDWWQSTQLEGIHFVATPAQHFSGRGFGDANRTLWVSWVVIEDDLRVFFSGDSGYSDGFKAIGDKYGPFDLTLIENGAYDAHWPDVHMQPEETLQAHLDLRGSWLLPIHNGTFDLGLHVWQQPFERISALANAHDVALSTPRIGERVDMAAPHAGEPWWHGLG